MKNENLQRTHYPALDGLRGIAILLVVLSHNFKFISFLNYGWLGVDLFFVLSGFLITDILLNTKNNRNYYKNFYARRVLRIFPVYYLSLLLFLILLPSIKNFPVNLNYSADEKLWFLFYLQNWMLIIHPNPSSHTLGHFWSLGVEEQFYVLWPVIIFWVKNHKKLLLGLFVVLAVLILTRTYIWIHREHYPSYYSIFLFTRIDGLVLGSALAILQKENPGFLRKTTYAIVFFLAGFNFLFYFLNLKNNFSFPYWSVAGYTTFAALFAIVVYEGVTKENRLVNFFLTNRILRFFGKYSYGLYIFHWPVYLLIVPYTNKLAALWFHSSGLLPSIFSSTLATCAGIIVSLISYHCFEKHFLRIKKKFV